jgi:hypothetical protein
MVWGLDAAQYYGDPQRYEITRNYVTKPDRTSINRKDAKPPDPAAAVFGR